ncbi:hypothetical protein PCC79_16550 [Propioniciclava soli]|uniref:Site-specific DNA-methyltransferase (adenine-specific) n=1 Tax=Propioniciclava soli TaxID=2775081 RepID=A0ABZ3C9N9_9ACTN
MLINETDPVNGNPWGIKFMTMFHMSNDSHLFHTWDELEADGWTLNGNVFEQTVIAHENREARFERMLPLYEAKMIHQFDHRWATYEPAESIRDVTLAEKQDPTFVPLPRYWVREEVVRHRLGDRWGEEWILGWRNICRSTDERTTIGSRFPAAAVGQSLPLILTRGHAPLLQAIISSFVFDFVARQKLGGINMTFGYFSQFAAPLPSLQAPWLTEAVEWFERRSLHLQSPASWRVPSRDVVRGELDAACFHIYGLGREEVEYVMDTFPIVKRKDEAAYGTYRTKDLILSAYDAMAEAKSSGRTYQPPWPQEVSA